MKCPDTPNAVTNLRHDCHGIDFGRGIWMRYFIFEFENRRSLTCQKHPVPDCTHALQAHSQTHCKANPTKETPRQTCKQTVKRRQLRWADAGTTPSLFSHLQKHCAPKQSVIIHIQLVSFKCSYGFSVYSCFVDMPVSQCSPRTEDSTGDRLTPHPNIHQRKSQVHVQYYYS